MGCCGRSGLGHITTGSDVEGVSVDGLVCSGRRWCCFSGQLYGVCEPPFYCYTISLCSLSARGNLGSLVDGMIIIR